jgi:hypothetical protein
VVGGEASWWRRRLPLRGGGEGLSVLPVTWADDLLGAIEARTLWSRYGL